MQRFICSLALLALLSAPMAVFAGAPAAIVEHISDPGQTIQLEAFDFVEQGQRIELGTAGVLELGYLGNCMHEQITGGSVLVGADQSSVQGGRVARSQVNCDGQTLAMAANESMQSGVIAFRDPFKAKHPPLTIYSPVPLIALSGAGKLVIKRIDSVGERHSLRIEAEAAGRRIIDLSEQGISLVAGASYMASFSGKSIKFRVDESADVKNRSPLQRIVPL